ncbi:MAG: SulP family inorganic anion transporter [Hyphomicrobiaceae bacterium]
MQDQRADQTGQTVERATGWPAYWQLFVPKLIITLREGYDLGKLRADAMAGLTVAILALPLSMAIAIGAGGTPGQGLVTSVVAGFLISALGGSRFQIGGPAAAFIVIVAQVANEHGWDGMVTATFLAGIILVIAGFLKLGAYIRYIPGPVIIGFTSGIGVLIAIGQIKDFFGLSGDLPAETIERLIKLVPMLATFNIAAFLVGLATLALIVGLKRWRPAWPGLLIAVFAGSGLVWLLGLPVETVGTRFGGIPSSLPAPVLPNLSWSKINEVMGSAFTIAFLVGVESLLSAVAADTIAGSRHRSNVEVVAQGFANIGSALFGGLPATGVIARTGTNISAGAKTPMSGVLHALFVLVFILALAPLASYLALPCLAAVLINVSWRLIDAKELQHFLWRAPWDDRVILAATLSLTVLVDLNVAIAVGVVLACMLFMHRMAEMPGIELGGTGSLIVEEQDDLTRNQSEIMTMRLPEGVKVIQFRGPLFFGAASHLSERLRSLDRWPRVMILRMREVPLADATAIAALDELARMCRKNDCRIIVSGLQRQPREAMHRLRFIREHRVMLASNSFVALEKAKAILEGG